MSSCDNNPSSHPLIFSHIHSRFAVGLEPIRVVIGQDAGYALGALSVCCRAYTESQTTIHTYNKFIITNYTNMHVFGLGEKVEVAVQKPYKHGDIEMPQKLVPAGL